MGQQELRRSEAQPVDGATVLSVRNIGLQGENLRELASNTAAVGAAASMLYSTTTAAEAQAMASSGGAGDMRIRVHSAGRYGGGSDVSLRVDYVAVQIDYQR